VKQDPVQWLRCYALSIENAGGNNDTKCLYFPFYLDQAPLGMVVLPTGAGIRGYPTRRAWVRVEKSTRYGQKIRPRARYGHQLSPAGIPATCI
jgi:hypothetical protein